MRTFTTNLPDDPPDGALELVLTWLSSELARPGSDEACALESWLQSGRDETALELCLSRSLLSALKCMEELWYWMAKDHFREGRHRVLQEWINSFSRLVDRIPPGCTDWCQSFREACKEGDRMLIAILGAALAKACEQFPMSAAARTVAVRACYEARKWCEKFPVPPAPNRSMSPEDYFFCDRHEALFKTLESLATALASRGDQVLFQLISQSRPERNSGTLDEDDLVITLEALSSALTEFLNGWPVEFVRLGEPLLLLRGFFGTDGATAPAAAELIGLVGRSLREFEACAAVSRKSSIPDSLTELESTNDATGITGLLKELITWLSKQNPRLLSRYHDNLCEITRAAEKSEREVSTLLLDMLIEFNTELCVPSSEHEELRRVRDRIHRILKTLNFVVLDEVLIGKPLSAVRHQVNVFRSYPSSSLPSDHVISVRQPGYLLSSGAGDLCLVRPAEVNVSR